MKEMIRLVTQYRALPKQPKVAKRAGAMRFSKCGTFKGFKFDE